MSLPVELLLYVHQIEQRCGRPAGGRGTFRSAEKLSGLRPKLIAPQLYLDLARLYDPLNNKYTDVSGVKGLTVPIVDENTTEDMARNNPRVTREAMFEFILRDLDDAEALLANYTSFVEDQSESGRGLRHQGACLPLAGRASIRRSMPTPRRMPARPSTPRNARS